MHRLSILLVTLTFLPIGCDRGSPRPTPTSSEPAQLIHGEGGASLILGEGGASSDKLSVTNGNVVQKENQPGIALAFVTKPSESKDFAYFVVFSHDFPNGGMHTQSSSDGLTARTEHTIEAFGSECNVEYLVKLTRDGAMVSTETISIAGETYDVSKGKLFLVDMKVTPATVVQINIDLPSAIPDLKETQAVEKFGEETLDELRKANMTVDEFCVRILATGT